MTDKTFMSIDDFVGIVVIFFLNIIKQFHIKQHQKTKLN
jgi:hypothetical protein